VKNELGENIFLLLRHLNKICQNKNAKPPKTRGT